MWGSGTVAVFAHEADKRKRIIIDFHNFRIVKKQLLTDCTKSNGEMPKKGGNIVFYVGLWGIGRQGSLSWNFKHLTGFVGEGTIIVLYVSGLFYSEV